jgi:protein TonB
VILAPGLLAQTQAPSPKTPKAHTINPPDACGCDFQISSQVAEKLLIRKVDPDACHRAMAARIIATVVVGFVIDKSGNVTHPTVVSGPAMLQKAALDAVRKYKYKPYLVNGKAVEVETTTSVTIDNYRDCPALFEPPK